MKQETLEEVAQKKYPIKNTGTILERFGLNYIANQKFIEGAKWKQERICDSEVIQRIRATKSDAEARRIIRTI